MAQWHSQPMFCCNGSGNLLCLSKWLLPRQSQGIGSHTASHGYCTIIASFPLRWGKSCFWMFLDFPGEPPVLLSSMECTLYLCVCFFHACGNLFFEVNGDFWSKYLRRASASSVPSSEGRLEIGYNQWLIYCTRNVVLNFSTPAQSKPTLSNKQISKFRVSIL